ncbi:GTP-binding protein [Populibacterium corticicola]|uniref:GTP-binding protein n=1 Tax=Populibacterium corticicola TaxID=1812826 RepID=A0ABW5XG33_9MICO
MSTQVSLILVTGVRPEPMAAATVSMQWDIPRVVALTHHIDVEAARLTRTVSDASGLLENVIVDLEHACVSCAIREDIIPTVQRLAESGRWGTIIVNLPVGAEAVQICRVIAWDKHLEQQVKVSCVVAAISAQHSLEDLRGEELLIERGQHSASDDYRGVAEVQCALVEHADLIVADGSLALLQPATQLITSLARPKIPLVEGAESMPIRLLTQGLHDHEASERWIAEVRRERSLEVDNADVWVLDFSSPFPFHPGRLLERIEELGSHQARARGCFWVPTRPDLVCRWEGAGGQLSIGTCAHWGSGEKLSRIVVTGVGDGRDELRRAFESVLITEYEAVTRGMRWNDPYDGLEPWLGEISEAH